MDYFHYCFEDMQLTENRDEDWSMQATRGSDDEKDLSKGEKKKEPPCRGHPSFKGFLKFQKEDEERIAFLHKYVKDNRGDFCDTCRLNMKFTYQFFANTKHL